MRETWVQSLSQEDPLEKEMATHSSTLAWRIPWREEPGSYSPWGHKELDTTERLHFNVSVSIKWIAYLNKMSPRRGTLFLSLVWAPPMFPTDLPRAGAKKS